MKNRFLCFFAIFMIITALNSSWAQNHNRHWGDSVEKLRWLYKADPKQDAMKAMDKGDYRLMAVNGYAFEIPEIRVQEYKKYEKSHGIRLIEGTSDMIENEEHGRLNSMAYKYAHQYNQIILKHKK